MKEQKRLFEFKEVPSDFGEGDYYTLGHISQFTGLTDRTLRNYLTMGLLKGEKINGIWHFTSEEVEDFISNPTVKPSILAKNNAIVYDFMLDDDKNTDECCILLDLPKDNRKEIIEFFCYSINNGEFQNLKFSLYAPEKKPIRIILKGDTLQVLKLVNSFYTDK